MTLNTCLSRTLEATVGVGVLSGGPEKPRQSMSRNKSETGFRYKVRACLKNSIRNKNKNILIGKLLAYFSGKGKRCTMNNCST